MLYFFNKFIKKKCSKNVLNNVLLTLKKLLLTFLELYISRIVWAMQLGTKSNKQKPLPSNGEIPGLG